MKRYIKARVQRRTFIIVLFLVLLLSGVTVSGDPELTTHNENRSYLYPKLNLAGHLYVIKNSAMNEAERVMIETLQGIVAQDKAEIYIDFGGSYEFWLKNLQEKYNITYDYVNSPWDLVAKFKNKLDHKGFIAYDPVYAEINVACTLSGVLRYVAVANSLTAKAKANGLVLKMNTRGKDEIWAFRNYRKKLYNGIIFQQNYNNPALRDYGVALQALYYADTSLTDTDEIYAWLRKNSPVMGWGPRAETDQVSLGSSLGMFTVASDHANNLSVFSGLPREDCKQHPVRENATITDNVHYVTFIMSDGDNVQWFCNGAPFESDKMGSKEKGLVPFGWSISPSLVDLAPNIMRYCYDTATDNDYFVAAVSGVGYMYPTKYPKTDLPNFAKLTNDYMKRAGLKYVSILDSAPSQDVVDVYAAQEQIEGGFYFYGFRYVAGHGAIWWSNGKPFIAARETLWETDPLKMAVRLNSYKRDPKTVEGYTVVNVHAWSHNYSDVLKISSMLDSHVVIVTPDEFIRLIKKNLPQENVEELHDVTNFDYSVIPQ